MDTLNVLKIDIIGNEDKNICEYKFMYKESEGEK